MSSSNTITLQEFIQIYTQEVYQSIATHHLLYAGLTIMVWDSLLTLSQEVENVWCRKFTVGSYFYLFSRYGTMASLLVTSFGDLVSVGPSCIKYESISIIATILSTHAFFALFTARAYAISGNRKLVLLILLPIDLARFVANIITIPTIISICEEDNNLPASLVKRFNIEGDIQAALNIATQTLCFLITLYHTFGTWRTFRKIPRQSKNLSVLVLEQGFYEFGLMALLVILTNTLLHTLPENSRAFASATPISVSLPTILLSRFFLALRERNTPVIKAVQVKYGSGTSWTSSHAKLIAEFGEQSQASQITTAEPSDDDIPLTPYAPVATYDDSEHLHVQNAMDEDELGHEVTPLRYDNYHDHDL